MWRSISKVPSSAKFLSPSVGDMIGDIPRIALTPGEPAGIGPELVVRLAQKVISAQLVVFADPELLHQRAESLGIKIEVSIWPGVMASTPHRPGHLWVAPIALALPSHCGKLDPGNADYVLESLRQAVQGCLRGDFDALVTGPVHKGIINAAGIPFSGHTEFLAQLSNAFPVMMLAAPKLRVALVTTHLPLAVVPNAITPDLLRRVIQVLDHDLRRRFGLVEPRILVCGLNPHAGEGGHLGREEIEIIAPVLAELCAQGLRLRGPVPADTAFTSASLIETDVVLAMYHDQGLPVLKHQGFGQAVNISLGLPFIRTSVDHGTALELAGGGHADIGSLYLALNMAIRLTYNERSFSYEENRG